MTDEERDARIGTLTDAIAETNRAVNALAADLGETHRIVSTVVDAVSDTNRNVATLAGETAFLQRLMHTHLVVDHDYDPSRRGDRR